MDNLENSVQQNEVSEREVQNFEREDRMQYVNQTEDEGQEEEDESVPSFDIDCTQAQIVKLTDFYDKNLKIKAKSCKERNNKDQQMLPKNMDLVASVSLDRVKIDSQFISFHVLNKEEHIQLCEKSNTLHLDDRLSKICKFFNYKVQEVVDETGKAIYEEDLQKLKDQVVDLCNVVVGVFESGWIIAMFDAVNVKFYPKFIKEKKPLSFSPFIIQLPKIDAKSGKVVWQTKNLMFDVYLVNNLRVNYVQIIMNPRVEPQRGILNFWSGFKITAVSCAGEKNWGDCFMFFNHIRYVWCQNNLDLFFYVLSYFSRILQVPEKKTGICLGIAGEPGEGKGIILSQLFKAIIGPAHFAHIQNFADIVNDFNSALTGKIYVFLDEAESLSDEKAKGIIKTMITEDSQRQRELYKDPTYVDSFMNVVSATNLEAVFKNLEPGQGRRILNLKTDLSAYLASPQLRRILDPQGDCSADQLKLKYFNTLADCIQQNVKTIANFFYNFDITKFNPTLLPKTKHSLLLGLESLPVAEQWWYETISSGIFFHEESIGSVEVNGQVLDNQPIVSESPYVSGQIQVSVLLSYLDKFIRSRNYRFRDNIKISYTSTQLVDVIKKIHPGILIQTIVNRGVRVQTLHLLPIAEAIKDCKAKFSGFGMLLEEEKNNPISTDIDELFVNFFPEDFGIYTGQYSLNKILLSGDRQLQKCFFDSSLIVEAKTPNQTVAFYLEKKNTPLQMVQMYQLLKKYDLDFKFVAAFQPFESLVKLMRFFKEKIGLMDKNDTTLFNKICDPYESTIKRFKELSSSSAKKFLEVSGEDNVFTKTKGKLFYEEHYSEAYALVNNHFERSLFSMDLIDEKKKKIKKIKKKIEIIKKNQEEDELDNPEDELHILEEELLDLEEDLPRIEKEYNEHTELGRFFFIFCKTDLLLRLVFGSLLQKYLQRDVIKAKKFEDEVFKQTVCIDYIEQVIKFYGFSDKGSDKGISNVSLDDKFDLACLEVLVVQNPIPGIQEKTVVFEEELNLMPIIREKGLFSKPVKNAIIKTTEYQKLVDSVISKTKKK